MSVLSETDQLSDHTQFSRGGGLPCNFAVNVTDQKAFYVLDNCAFAECSANECGVDFAEKPCCTEYESYRCVLDSNTRRKRSDRLKLV